MTKARDLANLIAAGNPLADGAISVAEISDLTASAAELNQLDNTADLPDIRPSLLLDFANSKTLDPRITFTRGSTATYWDGKTTAKAEENLLKYSQAFDHGYWNKAGVTITANATTAPDGTTTADQVTADGVTSDQYVQIQYTNMDTSSEYTLSVWLKTASGTQDVNIGNMDVGQYSTATVTDTWQRFEVTQTPSATTRYPRIFSKNTSSITVYVWGAQLEQRSSATAYTATTSSPIVKYQPTLQTAASGEARFDHDPVTGESKGLLIEEARTNLLLTSEDFTSIASANRVANSVIAPDGQQTADEFIGTGGDVVFINKSLNVTSGTTYTISEFVKLGSYTGDISILLYGNDFNSDGINPIAVTFDIANKTVTGTPSPEFIGYGIEDVGNGWVRIWASAEATNTNNAAHQIVRQSEIQIGKSFYVWGAQLEQGSFPTSYIPTSGSTVTRAKDDAVMTGSNFTDWYTGPPLSVYGEYALLAEGSPSQRLFSLDDGGYANRLLGVVSASNGFGPYMEVFHNDVNTFSGSVATGISGTPSSLQKLVGAFDTDDFATSRNGGTVGVDSSGTIPPTLNQLRIGSMANAALHMSGTIKKLAFYPKRLSNATLQAMTEA